MAKEKEQLAEAILNHALEIICLLTVEDFIVVKRPCDGTRCTFSIRGAEINSNANSSSGYPELLFTLLGMGDKTQKIIAELASKIVKLLTIEVPEKGEDVAVHLSKDEWVYVEGHGDKNKTNQDTRISAPVKKSTEKMYPISGGIKEEPHEEPHHGTEKPTAPAQQSTAKSSPIICCIKEEPDKEPHHVAEQPITPVQQSTEKSYPIIYRIKGEPNAKVHHVTGGISALPPSASILGSPAGEPPLPTVIVHIPLVEGQTASGISFFSSCDFKPEPVESSSDDTMDSVDTESPQFPSSPDREHEYNIIEHIKEEPEESQDSYISVTVDSVSPDCSYKDEDYLPPNTDFRQASMHMSASGQTSLTCEVCAKIFGSKSSLEKHLQIHTGQRPFPCSECDKKFSCKNHLTTHERSHSGERPFLCNQCGRRFFKQQHLILHQVTHTGEKPFSCPVCGKGFTRQSSVVKHSAMHAEQKPFVCDQCGKSYCQYASLVVHQRVHSGEKPFVCRYCEKGFMCKATMLKHEKSHTR